MTDYELDKLKHNMCLRVANQVLSVITEDIITARNLFPALDKNQYINNYISLGLEALIATASYGENVLLTSVAVKYIDALIRMQNNKREQLYIARELQLFEPRPAPVRDVMKKLETVISCRPAQRSKKTDTLVSCGVCYDDFKPNQVVKTGCDHEFCTGCISNWAKQRGIKSFIQCPLCRAEIDTLTVGTKTELKKLATGLAPILLPFT